MYEVTMARVSGALLHGFTNCRAARRKTDAKRRERDRPGAVAAPRNFGICSMSLLKLRPRAVAAIAALVLSATALSGCVYYPGYGYGGGYGYAAPPVVVVPGPIIVGGYGGYGRGWR